MTIFLCLISGLFEVTFLIGAKPFINILLNNSELDTQTNVISNSFLFSTILFSLLILLNSVSTIISAKYISKSTAIIGARLIKAVSSGYLSLNFKEFCESSSSSWLNSLTVGMDRVVFHTIRPTFILIRGLVSSLGIGISLFFLVNEGTFLGAVIVVLAYIIFGNLISKNLKNYSILKARYQQNLVSKAKEILNGWSLIRVANIEDKVNKDIYNSSFSLREKEVSSIYISEVAKPTIEAIGFITICLIILFDFFKNGKSNELIPSIAILALSSQKIIPYLQSIFASWVSIKAYRINRIEVIKNIAQSRKSTREKLNPKNTEVFSKVVLDKISFKYPNGKSVLNNFSLDWNFGEHIGIYAPSGSGKSTLLNIISRIVENDQLHGRRFALENDKKNKNSYPKIEYLSQDPFFVDQSLKANLLLTTDEFRNNEFLIKTIKKVGLYEWFLCLENGLKTQLNSLEKGISGGQKKRLALARLICSDCKWNICDEPFTGLDKESEIELLEILSHSLRNKSLIIVAHDFSSLKFCDKVISISQKGSLKIIKTNK